MKFFTVYSKFGQIIRSGVCADGDLARQASLGELVIEAQSSCTKDYVKNGAVVPLPVNPFPFGLFDYSANVWREDNAAAEKNALEKRAGLLALSDWTQMPDVVSSKKADWADYRQALRDITEQSGYPLNITWPTPPA